MRNTEIANEKPLITVVGALSKQGRSVAQALLQSGRYRVRALTRRIDSAKAQHLARQGAQLVAVPLRLGNRRELVEAFRGSHGAFLLTPGIAPPDASELPLGKELADAAVEAGVKHVVFSSLENVEARSGGTKWAPHFTDKAKIEAYIRSLPIISSFVYLGLFFTNVIEYYPPRQQDGVVTFALYLDTNKRFPFVDPLTATGPAVLEMFDHPAQYDGKGLPIISEFLNPNEMVQTFSRVTGKQAIYKPVLTKDAFLAQFPMYAANDLLVQEIMGMAEYIDEYGYYAEGRDLTWSRRINPHAHSWESFLRASGWQGEPRSYGATQ